MRKHRITVKLNWASLNRDVRDKAFRMVRLSKLSVEDETAADKAESELTLTDDDMHMLRRAMTQGLAEVITMCHDYVWSQKHTSDNYIMSGNNATITLMMPFNFNLAGCESLGHAVHAYIVAKALLEWFRYTAPARAAEQQDICAAARSEILTIIHARAKVMRSGESLTVIIGNDTAYDGCTCKSISTDKIEALIAGEEIPDDDETETSADDDSCGCRCKKAADGCCCGKLSDEQIQEILES